MPQLKHSTHSITLEVPYDFAFDYLSDWRNQTEWGINFVQAIREEDDQIIMTTPFGETPVEFVVNQALGTIDLHMNGTITPTRLVEIADSLVYTFTFSMPAVIPEEEFRQGQLGMEQELAHLKQVLESKISVAN